LIFFFALNIFPPLNFFSPLTLSFFPLFLFVEANVGDVVGEYVAIDVGDVDGRDDGIVVGRDTLKAVISNPTCPLKTALLLWP